jgi:hypothetical protein
MACGQGGALKRSQPMSESAVGKTPTEEAPYWHLVPFSLFAIINIVIWILWPQYLIQLKEMATPFSILLWGLAVYRIANIVSNEQVTRVLRAPFIDQQETGSGHIEETPRPAGLKHTIGSLLYCPSCVGVWASALIVYLLLFAPTIGWVAVVLFALSGVERIVSAVLQLLNRICSEKPEA